MSDDKNDVGKGFIRYAHGFGFDDKTLRIACHEVGHVVEAICNRANVPVDKGFPFFLAVLARSTAATIMCTSAEECGGRDPRLFFATCYSAFERAMIEEEERSAKPKDVN